eukprot:SAG31_NODE_17859_length_655_cov_1.255396_1_plen_156_part_00
MNAHVNAAVLTAVGVALISGTAAAAATAGAAEPILFRCGDLLTVDGPSNYSWTLAAFQAPQAPPIAGGPFALLHGGRWLSSADGSLVLRGAERGNGTDAHGPFTRLTLAWAARDSPSNASPWASSSIKNRSNAKKPTRRNQATTADNKSVSAANL